MDTDGLDMAKHKFTHWRYLNLHGRERKKLLNPSRERVLVRSTLSELSIRYREKVLFINHYWHTYKGDKSKAPQWLDFVCYKDGLLFVLEFDPHKPNAGGLHERQRMALEAKEQYLKEKGVPYLILSRTETSQIYRFCIEDLIRRHRE